MAFFVTEHFLVLLNNCRLDAELGPIDNLTTNLSTLAVSKATLLTLPGELRNRIYELLLFHDRVVFPYGYKPCGCDCPKRRRHAPAVALLGVNRQINKEASEILYGGVTFHLSMGHQFMRFMSHGQKDAYGIRDPSQVFPSRPLIRSLSLEFAPDNMAYDHDLKVMGFWALESFRALSKQKRLKAIHDLNRRTCQMWWDCAGRVIKSLPLLEDLTLDVSQSFCPMGCCRMAGYVVHSLRRIRNKEGLDISVEGELNPKEKDMILEGLNKAVKKAVKKDENDEENGERGRARTGREG